MPRSEEEYNKLVSSRNIYVALTFFCFIILFCLILFKIVDNRESNVCQKRVYPKRAVFITETTTCYEVQSDYSLKPANTRQQ